MWRELSKQHSAPVSHADDAGLHGCDTVSFGKLFPKFQTNIVPTYSSVKQSEKN
jgi:hypothetical protein